MVPTPTALAAPPIRPRFGRRAAFGPGSIVPGLALTLVLAAGAEALHQLPGLIRLSPMMIAIILGGLQQNLIGTPAWAKAGVTFALRRVLRLAVALLGLQLTAQQVAAVGGAGVGVIVATVVATLVITKYVGRLIGVERRLAELIAAGTAICGASAVIATNSVTEGSDEDVAYAVACVTLFGTLSMVLGPLVGTLIGLGPHAYGLWIGASIHEVAQVVAAAYQHGAAAGQFGTIAKLSRVLLLAPVVIGLGLSRRRAGSVAAPVPWFVIGFVALVGVNSLGLVPTVATRALVPATTFLLTVALAAMGLETDLARLRAKGLRPLALGAFAWLFIAGFSLGLVMLIG